MFIITPSKYSKALSTIKRKLIIFNIKRLCYPLSLSFSSIKIWRKNIKAFSPMPGNFSLKTTWKPTNMLNWSLNSFSKTPKNHHSPKILSQGSAMLPKSSLGNLSLAANFKTPFKKRKFTVVSLNFSAKNNKKSTNLCVTLLTHCIFWNPKFYRQVTYVLSTTLDQLILKSQRKFIRTFWT